MSGRRLRVILTLESPGDGDLAVFTWLLRWIIRLHATAPVGLRIRVEALPPDDPP